MKGKVKVNPAIVAQFVLLVAEIVGICATAADLLNPETEVALFVTIASAAGCVCWYAEHDTGRCNSRPKT